MTQATDLAFTSRRASDSKLIASVSAAHFVSHFYMLVLPPLFAAVRIDYNVSYIEIGLVLTVFNVVSAVLQTPAGFLVDRVDPRLALVAGLVTGAVALVIAGLVDSFWMLIVTFALLGVGNTVYHPADYSLLSHSVAPERTSHAFSVHTFAGMLGSASAPVSVLFMQSLFGWRGAFFGAAALGLLVAAVLFVQREPAQQAPARKPRSATAAAATRQLLLSAPILMNVAFFMLIGITSFGIQNFSVVALGALNGTAPITANTALSAYLVLSATGVLIGGWIAGRTARHGLVAMLGLTLSAAAIISLGFADPNAYLLILLMSFAGLCSGAIMPARDMLVRAVTPPGAFGTVFGFVTNGFNIAGIIAPLIYGALMDHGSPRGVLILIGACSLAAVATVMSSKQRDA